MHRGKKVKPNPETACQAADAAGPPSVQEHVVQTTVRLCDKIIWSGACRGLSDLQKQTVTVNAEDLAGGEYSLTNLTGCTVHLEGPMSALQIRNLADCLVTAGPVKGPTFVYGECLAVSRMLDLITPDLCMQMVIS